jgi:hypothetical protein
MDIEYDSYVNNINDLYNLPEDESNYESNSLKNESGISEKEHNSSESEDNYSFDGNNSDDGDILQEDDEQYSDDEYDESSYNFDDINSEGNICNMMFCFKF